MDQAVIIKANQYGFTVALDPEMDFNQLCREVAQKFHDSAKFFGRANVVLSFEGRELTDKQLQTILETITDNCGMQIACILDGNEEQERRFQSALERRRHSDQSAGADRFYKGTLRSGQLLESEGDVVILGDVNPGATVNAAGNIVVLGSLNGSAYAGTFGNDKAVIVALEMDPTQLGIGDARGRGEENRRHRRKPLAPKIAFSGEGGIYIEDLCREVISELDIE